MKDINQIYYGQPIPDMTVKQAGAISQAPYGSYPIAVIHQASAVLGAAQLSMQYDLQQKDKGK